ncbi:MAG: hypothetical protein IJY05_00705 [Clostridia bacterium]|nr:hypothetical protein [Clostridia bacterium]
MKVKECVEKAAMLLGIADEVCAYLNEGDTQGQEQTERLVKCFNLVENELALDYLPLFAEQKVVNQNGKVDFLLLQKNVVRIAGVKNKAGESVKFRLFPKYFEAPMGELTIIYSYTPPEKTLDGESDYATLSARLFGYGMAMNYALIMGLYEEASVWDKKYKEALEAAYRIRGAAVIRSRRWV